MPTKPGLDLMAPLLVLLMLPAITRGTEPTVEVAFANCDITPAPTPDRPVWLAGYLPGRAATGIHDRLYARCAVLRHENRKIALISLDLIGLQYPAVLKVRERLVDYDYVVVSSTHNHEGPDVIGVWGRTIFQGGVDEAYVTTVVDQVVQLVRSAEAELVPAGSRFGLAEDETLLDDGRLPLVKDGTCGYWYFPDPVAAKLWECCCSGTVIPRHWDRKTR